MSIMRNVVGTPVNSFATTTALQQQQRLTTISNAVQPRPQTITCPTVTPTGITTISSASRLPIHSAFPAATTGTRIVYNPSGAVRVLTPTTITSSGIGVVPRLPTVAASPGATTLQNSIRSVVINQPGRPGQPASQITVPLPTLQALQPGQGISTGQPGHLLVKTDGGQYQILRVENQHTQSAVVGAVSSLPSTSAASSTLPSRVFQQQPHLQNSPIQQNHQLIQTTRPVSHIHPAAVVASNGGIRPGVTASTPNSATPSVPQQMTPDTAKLKCKNFLATLLRLASEQPDSVASNVRTLIQGLIDGNVEPEEFTTKLQRQLNSSPQPCLVPFLKKSLPYLQHSLRTGELSIEGVRAPQVSSINRIKQETCGYSLPTTSAPMNSASSTTALRQHRLGFSTIGSRPIVATRGNVLPGTVSVNSNVITRPSSAFVSSQPQLVTSNYSQVGSLNKVQLIRHTTPLSVPNHNIPKVIPPSNLVYAKNVTRLPFGVDHREIQKDAARQQYPATFTTTGDEDINDVAAMGGVNLAEESQRMSMISGDIGAQVRSCRDEPFLPVTQLRRRITDICHSKGLTSFDATSNNDVYRLLSHALENRLRDLIERLSITSEHRLDSVCQTPGPNYELVQDIRGQLRFLGDIDRLERRRNEEAERETLLRAAKSRNKSEDPEKERLRVRAKELQRLEDEQVRHDKANNTALMAIGGPRHKLILNLEEDVSLGQSIPPSGSANPTSNKLRTKRVHLRDLLSVLEQEKHVKRSKLLWKAYVMP